MRVTPKGQVTIPVETRKQADRKMEETITPTHDKDRGVKLVARMRNTGDVIMSTDEIMALTRGD
jgi:bifunctional DNA-binding transcriptional regulator/antitoxin component of YhaV-PrlF toxin-antitoxin module